MTYDLHDADERLGFARKNLPIGTYIQHANSNKTYKVVGHVLRENDLTALVLYEEAKLPKQSVELSSLEVWANQVTPPTFKPTRMWARPYDEIFERVTQQDAAERVDRFRKVKPQMAWVPVD